jgi:hypothetical protein
MSTVILTTTEKHEGQKLEIWVLYTSDDNTVESIYAVFIDSPVGMIPVGDLFISIPEMEVALNKIVDRTDWREVYREMQEDKKEAA